MKKGCKMKKVDRSTRYSSIDGLRALSCLGIILMHIQANTNYKLYGNLLYDEIIPSFTWLVYLFLLISAFGMCVGYLEKFWNRKIDLEKFYKKRYKKILPFFGFLILIAIIISWNLNSFYEATIELLVLNGFLPNNELSLLGVSWTLGVIFIFYFMFPVFSVVFKNKKRAWACLGISLWINYICDQYFFSDYFVVQSFTPRHSFIFCLPFFVMGGIIYIYKEKIADLCSARKKELIFLVIVSIILWYAIPSKQDFVMTLKCLIVYSLILAVSIGWNPKFLGKKLLVFLSSISMEMYLAQMVIFRLIEKLNLLYLIGDTGIGGWLSLICTFLLVVIGLIVFIFAYRVMYKVTKRQIRKIRTKRS